MGTNEDYYQQQPPKEYYQQTPSTQYYQPRQVDYQQQQPYYQQQQPQVVYVQQPPQNTGNNADCANGCLAGLCACLSFNLLLNMCFMF